MKMSYDGVTAERYASADSPVEDPRSFYAAKIPEAEALVARMQSSRLLAQDNAFREADEALETAAGRLRRMDEELAEIRDCYAAMLASIDTDLGRFDDPEYVERVVGLSALRRGLDEELLVHKRAFVAEFNGLLSDFVAYGALTEEGLLVDPVESDAADEDLARCVATRDELQRHLQYELGGGLTGSHAERNRRVLRAWALLEQVEEGLRFVEHATGSIRQYHTETERAELVAAPSGQRRSAFSARSHREASDQRQRDLDYARTSLTTALEHFDEAVGTYHAFARVDERAPEDSASEE